jgi:NAD(P)-dependent dehydrogenase (short-subunit alcohol dehydrogenase family)
VGKLSGKVALITGAGQGIGKETAQVLTSHGATVVVADLNGAAAIEVAKGINAGGGKAMALTVDLISEEQIRSMVAQVIETWGRIDIVHNNAALQTEEQISKDVDVCRLTVETWDLAMAVNARGPMLVCKHVIPHMIKQGGGSIINASSGLGVQGELSQTAYGASKAALINLSRFIATQYGKQGIRSNVIVIGRVRTEKDQAPSPVLDLLEASHLTPYLGKPRFIADTVAFLASDEAAFITGAIIPVDGGFTSHSPAYAQFRDYLKANSKMNTYAKDE